MAYTGKRSWHFGPWAFCARCVDRVHIATMSWQRGLLLCCECVDTGINPLVGDREIDIARSVEQPTQELMPDPKLQQPDIANAGSDDIFF